MRYHLQTNPGVLAILVRHGATELNNGAKKVRGWEDVELSKAGENEVRRTAQELRQYDPQYIVSSDFTRDASTAQLIASQLNISNIETDFNARTWDVGSFSGQPESEVNPAIEQLYGRSWETPPGSSESFDGFSRRWQQFLDSKMDFATIEGMRPIIIVTHGRNLALTDSYLNFKTPRDGMMPFAGGYGLISVTPDRSLDYQIQGESECVCQDV